MKNNYSRVTFTYTNHRGIKSIRSVQVLNLRFGSTKWHKKPQWLLVACDLDRGEIREFSMSEIENWDKKQPEKP